MIRHLALGLFGAAALLLADVAMPTPADATPGMLNAQGCHGHPRHCHPRGQWSTNTSGRHYVAGHFSHGHRSHHRRGRRYR